MDLVKVESDSSDGLQEDEVELELEMVHAPALGVKKEPLIDLVIKQECEDDDCEIVAEVRHTAVARDALKPEEVNLCTEDMQDEDSAFDVLSGDDRQDITSWNKTVRRNVFDVGNTTPVYKPSKRSISKREIHNTIRDWDTEERRAYNGSEEEAEDEEESTESDQVYYEDEETDESDDDDSEDELEVVSKRKRGRELGQSFEWADGHFEPKDIVFKNKHTGIQKTLDEEMEIVDFVKMFLCDELLELIVGEMNSYHNKKLATDVNNQSLIKWKETDVDEMYTFLAMCMLMVRNKKISVHEYWSTDLLLSSPVFPKIMSQSRFCFLISVLRLYGDEQKSKDRLLRIEKVLSIVRDKFRDAFQPSRNLLIRERWRLESQPSNTVIGRRFKMRLFVLCDVETGYILDFFPHTKGKAQARCRDDMGETGSIVTTLMKPYLHHGYNLYVKNLYITPALAHHLACNSTNVCGRVHEACEGMPKFRRKLLKGEADTKHSDSMMALAWRDIYMLSTFHSTPKASETPACILDYSKNTTVTDHKELLLSGLSCVCEGKWYKQVCFLLVDLCLENAYQLYRLKDGRDMCFVDFQMEAARQLLEQHNKTLPDRAKRSKTTRLSGRHFPLYVPGRNDLRPCYVCSHTVQRSRQYRETHYMCDKCSVALCVTPCFREYHTQGHY
ncbi:piggyBac transposable element-derived protein 4-like [Periplaneta americana]|uniref:piggyBac transposable element-derived protein 4-like n=1 Tax=Periplaneta americana TaxID=6978 RepID=UPI0037E98F7A